jgi:formyl-CoA transferase
MIQQLDVDTGGPVKQSVGFPGIVPVIGATSLSIRSAGPDLGEHTREVLSSLLGLSDQEIGALA